MKIKAILSDFDGTLIDINHQYNPGLKELVKKITSSGIHFSIATGRAYFSYTDKVIEELEIDGCHIFQGGGLIYNNKTTQVLWLQAIPANTVKDVIKYFKRVNINFSLETIDRAYMSKLVKYPTYGDEESLKSLEELTHYSDILKILIPTELNTLTEREIDMHIEKLASQYKEIAMMKIKIRNKFGMDVTSEKATKHTAVLEYEKLLSIPRDQMVGIGDGHNDYPLFTACGYKIAMGNAPQELKEIANFVAPPIEQNGTIVALQHIINKFDL